MHVGPIAVALTSHGDGVVEVACCVRVDGERGQGGELAAVLVWQPAPFGRRGRRCGHLVAKALAYSLCVDEGTQDRREALARTQRLEHGEAIAARRHGEHDVVSLWLIRAFGDQPRPAFGKQRLERPELAPAGDPIGSWPGRRRRVAHAPAAYWCRAM